MTAELGSDFLSMLYVLPSVCFASLCCRACSLNFRSLIEAAPGLRLCALFWASLHKRGGLGSFAFGKMTQYSERLRRHLGSPQDLETADEHCRLLREAGKGVEEFESDGWCGCRCGSVEFIEFFSVWF